ncbi:MAG: hypothetical protein LBH96_06955 [Candidatus Peribacteria bacterium]|nr:hypothetical protein [Candidatus Peribacteria bacterium]
MKITAPLNDISRVKQVFLAYQDLGLLQNVSPTDETNVSYLTLLREMAKMNAAMKYFISVDDVGVLSDYIAGKPFSFSFNS